MYSSRYDIFTLPSKVDITAIADKCRLIYQNGRYGDLVLIPWVISSSHRISDLEKLTGKFRVICAAGNDSTDISAYYPANHPDFITVGCLNKSGTRAALSNYSVTKEMAWAPGTNFYVGNKPYSGTSIAAAVYAGILASSINDPSIDFCTRMKEYQKQVAAELLSQT